jgi:hypothetical protein
MPGRRIARLRSLNPVLPSMLGKNSSSGREHPSTWLLDRKGSLDYPNAADCICLTTTFGKGSGMEKYLCYGALGVAGLMGLLFLLDLAIGIPFGGGPFMLPDIFGLLASGVVGYMGFLAMKELK